MSDPTRALHPPKRILLATDLSCRCDRAMDRAVQLAAEWGGRLSVLHVMDPADSFIDELYRDDERQGRRRPERTPLVERRLRRDLPPTAGPVDVLIDEGEPAACIDRVARELGADLIVTGMARGETFGRMLLGATASRLARRTPVPVLVVRSRVRAYGRVLVATDFSEASRHALRASLAFFPGAEIILLHAFEAPYLLGSEGLAMPLLKLAQDGAAQFFGESGLTPEEHGRVTLRIERGSPEAVVRRLMIEEDLRLVVMGSLGHGAAFDMLIGSTSRRVLDTAPADVLLVRNPRAVDVR